MALTRKMLEAMSIDEAKIDQIIEQHVQTVNEVKDERDRYKEQAQALDAANKRIKELEDATGGDGELQARYEALQQELADYKAQVESERDKARREALYRDALRDAGVDDKRIGSILKVTDLSTLELSDDGQLKDPDAVKARAAEEWSDFVKTADTRGADVDNPPAGAGAGMTRDQIMAIKDRGERQRAIAENHEMFGF